MGGGGAWRQMRPGERGGREADEPVGVAWGAADSVVGLGTWDGVSLVRRGESRLDQGLRRGWLRERGRAHGSVRLPLANLLQPGKVPDALMVRVPFCAHEFWLLWIRKKGNFGSFGFRKMAGYLILHIIFLEHLGRLRHLATHRPLPAPTPLASHACGSGDAPAAAHYCFHCHFL
jgi:hypothetical protein